MAAAAILRDLDDMAIANLASECLFALLGGSTDQIPLVGTLAEKVRTYIVPTDGAPLGRVTRKVARVYLGEVLQNRVPNERRIAYTAVQHATALIVLEGDLWA